MNQSIHLKDVSLPLLLTHKSQGKLTCQPEQFGSEEDHSYFHAGPGGHFNEPSLLSVLGL